MKHCPNCHRVNPDDVKECIECGGKEFQHIIPLEEESACYDRWENYREVKRGKEEMDKKGDYQARSS